ncbi:polyunsaturated fatty acid lipoxygenase ALOX15B-like [Alosa pseudoharengus]|uniref:polyunsaturated fatty acid lipoxygenase ALOX15B-like n=1 Tax=Alosa pseudoharengus TaxID=34774 RepID=UPI003F8B4252
MGEEWGIETKVTSIVTDAGANMVASRQLAEAVTTIIQQEPVEIVEERQFQLNFSTSLGVPLVMEVQSKPFLAVDNQWFCDQMSVSTPEEYVQHHWDEDELFGYQFLNGINPMMIQRCSKLPENFPVTDEMVKDSLNGSTLEHEMKNGNIFLVDYKMLDGLMGNVVHGRQQYFAAPLVLLYCNPEKLILPIAIQLMQEAGDENPIFLPIDSVHDWLLAKVYVRNADLLVQIFNFHITRTHALAEVFSMATLRTVPTVHPLFKLLIPHTRDTFNINVFLRQRLLADGGPLDLTVGIDKGSRWELLKRAAGSVTYNSLCLPDDISERGLENVPNYYYRDDGKKLWDVINKFVKGVLKHYYRSDDYVQKDTELQMWISEIYTKGFQGNPSTGIPKSFKTVKALVKFVTMVIFTTSGQHAAIHSGQLDFGGWMPNCPTGLSEPPPKVKGQTTEDTILKALPDQASTTRPPLGYFPEEWFGEEVPRKLIKDFQKDLEVLSDRIEKRNAKLKLPYTYLNPKKIKNSASI